MLSELKPCPFCGHATAPKLTLASSIFGDETGYYEHPESYAVMCDASSPGGPGGCGGDGGFAETEALAIEKWNRRAAIEKDGAQGVGDGWVRVPVEPTPHMLFMAAAVDGQSSKLSRAIYRAMLAAAPGAATPGDERAMFEEWANSAGYEVFRDDSDKYRDYHRATTRFAWEAWQARAARSVAQEPKP